MSMAVPGAEAIQCHQVKPYKWCTKPHVPHHPMCCELCFVLFLCSFFLASALPHTIQPKKDHVLVPNTSQMCRSSSCCHTNMAWGWIGGWGDWLSSWEKHILYPIRLVFPAGIIRIPVFSAPVVFFFTGNMIPVPPYSNFFGTSSGILHVWGLGRMLRRKWICRKKTLSK